MSNLIQRTVWRCIVAVLSFIVCREAAVAAPVGTAFTYQGKLASGGQPASGVYDFQFSLWDAATNGNAVAPPFLTNGITATDGLFSVLLDFGSGGFDGSARWLEIAVRTNGSGLFTGLTPRQPLTASPYALYALNSGTSPDLNGAIVATNPANQFQGSFSGNGAGLTNLVIPGSSITGAQLASQSVSMTNLILADSLRITCAGIDDFGINRFGWPHTLATLSTNGPLFVSLIGNGWIEDSEFCGFITNLLAYKPLAGFASSLQFYAPAELIFNPSIANTALYVIGDDTNWHGDYRVLTNTGSMLSPVAQSPYWQGQIMTGDVCAVHYLANPNGGSFVMEIRTNGAWAPGFMDLSADWTIVASANASNSTWLGRTLWWTNTAPIQTQIRARATSPGSTPIVGFAEWNSTITNGVVLSQYSHQGSGYWWTYLDANKVYPIWKAWTPDLVFASGDAWYGDLQPAPYTGTNMLQTIRSGLPNADIADVGQHVCIPPYITNNIERNYCFNHGIAWFDGEAASTAAWGGYSNGVALGLYADSAHLTARGYATFSQLLWSWMGLTSRSPAGLGGYTQ
jgi:hypothetical protein